MLVGGNTIAFVPSGDLTRAERFYTDVLGLERVSRDDFALVVEANGVTIRITNAGPFVAQAFTILGFEVEDVQKTARALAAAGVELLRYPGMKQDASGIWTSPSGARVAWFKDPDSNVLSITDRPA